MIHGKYHNFRIVFLYFCVCSAYLFIYLFFLFFDGAYGTRGVVCSFYRLCFYLLSSYFSSFLHGFYISFYTSFIICKYFIPKPGFYKYNTGGTFCSTILSYSILPSSFTAVFLEHCLCKILM